MPQLKGSAHNKEAAQLHSSCWSLFGFHKADGLYAIAEIKSRLISLNETDRLTCGLYLGNPGALLVACYGVRLEVSIKRTKHMFHVSLTKHRKKNYDTNIAYKFFRNVAKFEYLEIKQ